MNLSLKQKALVQTLAFVASAIAGGVIVSLLIEYVPVKTLLTALGIGIFTYIIYIAYQINLSQLQYKAKLEEMVTRKHPSSL